MVNIYTYLIYIFLSFNSNCAIHSYLMYTLSMFVSIELMEIEYIEFMPPCC